MRNNRMLTITLVGGLVVLAAGCVKEQDMNEMYRPEGTPIIFTAATGYENGNGTRTEYSGSFFDANGNPNQNLTGTANNYERIDWVANDPVKVFYAHGSGSPLNAVYAVSGTPSADDEISNASISVTSGSKLTWTAGGANHVFTAMYPTNGFNANSSLGNTYANNSITFNDGTHVTAQIPAAQKAIPTQTTGKYRPNMAYAYMIAYKEIASSSNDHEVYLPFTPAMTAFEFRFRMPATPAAGTSGKSFKVKSFRMHTSTSGKYLAGNFSFAISALKSSDGKARGGTWQTSSYSVSGGSQDITVTFDNPVDLSTSTDLDFTIFALPQDHTDITLYLTYVDGSNNEYTKHVDLKSGTPATFYRFDACKKYIITNYVAGYDEWEYHVDEIPNITVYGGHVGVSAGFEVRSYKQSKADPTYRVPVPWKIQYIDTTAVNPTWTDLDGNGFTGPLTTTVFKIRNSGDTGDGFTGNGSVPGNAKEARLSKIEGTHNSYYQSGSGAAAATRAKLASAPSRGFPVGTGTGPFDLSMHPYYGTEAQINTANPSMNTANCYVVSAPGYYMFPCVYGNSIKNGGDNKSAYWPSAAGDRIINEASSVTYLSDVNTVYNVDYYVQHFYTPQFYNAWNEVIDSPDIQDNCDITDANMNALVVWQDTNPHDEIIPYTNESSRIGVTSVSGSAYKYIWFRIDSEDIKPGNIVIALRDDDTIVWSWHIWVTEKDLSPTNTITNSTGTYAMMPYNLGWADTEDGGVIKYYDRALKYRVIQVEGGQELTGAANNEEFTMIEIGDSKETLNSVGGNPYYQWGRKDPLIPALPNGESRPVSPNPLFESVITTDGRLIPCEEIQHTYRDYGKGIKNPYIPYSNLSSTTWIGGPVYPYKSSTVTYWYLTKVDRGPFTPYEATILSQHGYGTQGWDMNYQGTGNYYFNGTYNTHYSTTDATWIITYVPNHFVLADFIDIYYTADQRSNASCPSNLWNSYMYTQRSAGKANKFKTIYDPCPVGYTVPVKEVFIANTPFPEPYWNSYITDNPPVNGFARMYSPTNIKYTTPKLLGSGESRSADNLGVTFGSTFFPYTGARVFYNNNGTPTLRAEAGSTGFYWTDCAETIEPNDIVNPVQDANIGNYWFYNHSLILMCSQNADAVQSYTRGSAGCIRPMLETNPRDLNDNGQ